MAASDAELEAMLTAPPLECEKEREEAEARRLAWLASEEGQEVLRKKEAKEEEAMRRVREEAVRVRREAADFARWRAQQNRARGIVPPTIPPEHLGRAPEAREEGG